MQAPAFFHGNIRALQDLAYVVEVINDGGSAMSGPVEIAGWYAYSAAVEGTDEFESIDRASLEAHLDYLIEAGAKIDFSASLDQAEAYLKAERLERGAS